MEKMFSAPLLTIFIAVFMMACDKDDTGIEKQGYAKGVFISCEGTFTANNGSISWFDPDSIKVVNNLFDKINGRPAGDVIQSFSIDGEYGIIVANNSGKVEIVDLVTFESTGIITGLSYPRFYASKGDGRGYISNGNLEGEVYEIDIESSEITDTIAVGFGPEQMIVSNGYLFVANSGGWGYDNTVSVIDIKTNELTDNIEVGDIPVAMVKDRDNKIWVLCRGKVVFNETWTEIVEETDSRLVRIDPGSMTISGEIVIGEKGDYFNPSWIASDPDGERIYYGESGGVFAISINDSQHPDEPVVEKYFSAAGIDPLSGNIFGLEVTDYASPGLLHIYDGENPVSIFTVGIAPNGIVFGN